MRTPPWAAPERKKWRAAVLCVEIIGGVVAVLARGHLLPFWAEIFAVPGILAITWNLLSGRSRYGVRERRSVPWSLRDRK